MTKTTKTLVLLDSHAIIHRAYHALPDFLSSKGEPTGALYGLSNMLMKIISDLKPDYIIACYDLPQKTFRHEAYEGYKAGRAKADEALITQIKSSRRIFEAFGIPIYDAPGFEADDILGTIVHLLREEKELKIIIASGDMDTMQLIEGDRVLVYTLKKGINDTILYDEKKVKERFGFGPKLLPDYKGLRGDPSDNIIGIKGIGEKIATTLISEIGSIENIYEQLNLVDFESRFKNLGLSDRVIKLLKENEEEAIFSKTLAKIRSDAKIEFSLPEKTFWQNIDFKKIENIFIEFDFRSLFARLKNLFNKNLPENVLEENETQRKEDPLSVKETSIALWLLNSDITNPNIEDILHYAKSDSFEKARQYVLERLKEKKLDRIYEEIERPLIPLVAEMQKNGILIDKKYFHLLSQEYHKELDKLTLEIYQIAGMEFNINSPKQLSQVLFEKMCIKSGKKKNANGNLSTKVSILEELEEDNPIVSKILAYRELQKLLSTYIDVIPNMIGGDGRLHAEFLQNGTTTGRFSSQNPNLQNLPIKSELGRKIRAGFIAEDNYKLVSFDYSQIELRVAAILSKDKRMIQIFKEGKDIHSGVAAFVFGVPIEGVDMEMRRKAKVINFGIIYGMGVNSLRKSLGGSKEEAQKFYDNYFHQFSGVRDYLEEIKNNVRKNLYTETLFGRRRFFQNINSRIPFLKNMAERTAINAPIQGTAADIIKLAIKQVEEDLKNAKVKEKVKLVLQIHDELVYEIEDNVLNEVEDIIKKSMENVLERSYLNFKTDVPLLVHFGSGKNLDEVK